MIPTQDARTQDPKSQDATCQEGRNGAMPDERAALPPAQGVLLWSMRAWVLGLARSTDMTDRIRGAFAGVDAAAAAAGLIGFMEALDEGGIRTIDVERMCNPRLSADERLLLGVFGAVGAGDAATAARVLRGMATARGVAATLGWAEDVASELTDAGHALRDGGAPATLPAGAATAQAVLH